MRQIEKQEATSARHLSRCAGDLLSLVSFDKYLVGDESIELAECAV